MSHRGSAVPGQRAMGRLVSAVCVLGILFGSCPDVRSANGDVLAISLVLEGTELTDIAFDSSANPAGGSFWVTGRLTGKIYHVAADLSSVLGEVVNPHGTGSIPNFILTWGIAYRSRTRSLLVLAQDAGKWIVREVSIETGTEVPGGRFEIVPPVAGASIRGLTYDPVAQHLWYLDSANELVVETDFTGAALHHFALPAPDPGNTILRGEGIAFEYEEVAPSDYQPRIYVAYGDVFLSRPSRVIQLTAEGAATGIEVPLTGVFPRTPRGIQTQRLGRQRRMVVVHSDGSIARIEQVIPNPVPPSNLQCRLTLANKVELAWENNGKQEAGAYAGEIAVLRNGVRFATLPGDAGVFVDPTPQQGTSEYSLQASDGVQFSPQCYPCEITVGTGGLVRWVPFEGNSVFDLTRDPGTGDIFVTDNIPVDGVGRIFHLDLNLNRIGVIDSPWERPAGIAYVPAIELEGVVFENLLAVGRSDSSLVALMTLDSQVKKKFPLMLGDGVTPQLGGMCYMPSTQEFAVIERSRKEIYVLDRNGMLVRSCVPSSAFGRLPDLDLGITFDPIRETFVSYFVDGQVRETYTGGICAPGDYEFTLNAIGDGYLTPNFVGGIEIAGNSLLVAGRSSSALFQVLIYPYSPAFLRGDVDLNETINLTDAVQLAGYLFQAGDPLLCQDAADANDDALLDISDPVYLLFHLFLQGPPPPPPYPEPGSDPTFRDNLGCDLPEESDV